MSTATHNAADSISSSVIKLADPERVVDVDQKHELVAEFLDSHQFDALLLQKATNISWFTSGADCARSGSSVSRP